MYEDILVLELCCKMVDLISVNSKAKEYLHSELRKTKANVEEGANQEHWRKTYELLEKFHFFTASLTGTQEVPPVSTSASASATFLYFEETKELGYVVTYDPSKMTSEETVAHIHVGRAGKLGDIVIPLDTGSPKQGTIVLNSEQEEWLFDGLLYVNIHSRLHPLGEIRGQIFPKQPKVRAKHMENEDEKKKKRKKKKKDDGISYSDDGISKKPNVEVKDPESEETVKSVIENNNMTGAPNVPRIEDIEAAMANLSDPINNILKLELALLWDPMNQMNANEDDGRYPVFLFNAPNSSDNNDGFKPQIVWENGPRKDLKTREQYEKDAFEAFSSALRKYPSHCFGGDKMFGLKARILKEEIIGTREIVNILVGEDEEFPMSIFVELFRNGSGEIQAVRMLQEFLDSEVLNDFGDFLKGLRTNE